MNKTQIVLNIQGGLVQEVFCSDPQANVLLVNWDAEPCNCGDPCIVEVTDSHNRLHLAYVVAREVHPLEELTGTDTEAAIEAAELARTNCPATIQPGTFPP